MTRPFVGIAAIALLAVTGAAVTPVRAGNGGDVAAGVLGGLVAGTLVGAAVSSPRYYAPPPLPAYGGPPGPYCYWTRGEPVWDGYRAAWVYPSVRVCE